jgi:Ni,Fe-hydrogenase III large subunit
MSAASPISGPNSDAFALLANGAALAWAEIPERLMAEFVRQTGGELDRGARLCAWFGVPDIGGTRIVAVLAYDADNTLAVGRSLPVSSGYDALTATRPQAHLFERELWEQHGITPHGHPWLKPVRATNASADAPAVGDFFRVHGPEVHEVAVGPVHAGVIEPGHFRFQCAGEEVLHLEMALGYQHRGVEKALLGGPHRSTMAQMETVAGDSTIAHATAYSSVLEALANSEPPLRAQWLRALALELERLANHTGDLGALANDVAFLPTSSTCGKVRGDFLNLSALLCGNRFGRALVRPGGCLLDLETDRVTTMAERLQSALDEVEQALTWFWDASSVRARFENVGVVFPKQATDIGLVGVAARGCGLVRDIRYDHPAGWYRFAQAPVAVWPGGDVYARARVRWLEIQRSGEFLKQQLTQAPDGPITENLTSSAADTLAVSLVEGWRGEVCHVALTNATGQFRQYKIVDPSFHNWPGLALALRGQAISDFPICNKSFNLSYCGFDL